MLQAFAGLFHQFQQVPEGSFYFFCGLAGYFVFQWVFFRPIRTYVFGHELTHAMAAWMTGGEVRRFHVSKKGGSVTVTKTNVFVALAPYIIPLYALLLLGIFYGVNFFYDLHRWWIFFLMVLGAAVGFHISLTVFALRQNQPDLRMAGTFLSGVLIFLGNALCVVFLLGILFPRTVSWTHFFRQSSRQTAGVYKNIGLVIYRLAASAENKDSRHAGRS